MPDPLPLPVRVLVQGASTVIWTSWMGGPRTDFAYPRAIEAALHGAGHPAEVRTSATAAQWTKDAFRLWPYDVIQWSPDVVVLNYGHTECIHRFLPRWLERHAHTLAQRPGPIRTPYRKHVVRHVWRGLSRVQRVVDARMPPTALWGRRRRHVADTLEYYISRVRTVASPLVLLVEIPPVGKPYQRWFPGMQGRVDAMNETLRAVVAKVDHPEVRMFPTLEHVLPLAATPEELAPDGAHLTPEAHQAVGQGIADVVLEWAEGQPHLKLPGPSAARRARGAADRRRVGR